MTPARDAAPEPKRRRIFLAVFPPAEVQRAAHGLVEALRRSEDRVSWVKPENLHYTLRFIGEVGDDGARRIDQAARDAAARHAVFDATLGTLGAFPDARRARVIWLGMTHGGEALVELARDLEAELRKRGFDRADHPFSAHLTLGRPRDFGQDWTDRLASAPIPAPAPAFRVDRVCVVESKLSPKGSTYNVRSEAALAH